MKLKELATLIVLGLALGFTTLIAFYRNPGDERSMEALSNERVIPEKKVVRIEPIQFVDEKSFESESPSVQRSLDTGIQSRVLKPGDCVTADLLTKPGALGLVVEARAAIPLADRLEGALIHSQEGVNTQRDLSGPAFPELQVTWEGEPVASIPLRTQYWQTYYVRVDGNGARQKAAFELRIPEGASAMNAAIKRAAIFSQDAETVGEHLRIGLSEAAFRASALKRKIVILGLDGLSWRIADPLLNQGRMPNLKKLIDQGARANLIDEPPLDSPKIWTTIATGVGPAEHGILERAVLAEGSNEPIPINSALRRRKALWNQFSDLGRQVGFVNWFITWPAESVNGFMVTDRARFESPLTVYPEMVGRGKSRYLPDESDLTLDGSEFARTVKHLETLLKDESYPARDPQEQVEFASLATRVREVYFNDCFFRNFGLDLFQRSQPDLFALYFHGTDAISHAFYKFRFPEENFDVSPAQVDAIGDSIAAIYEFHDRTLGQLIQLADPETTWVVLSDHGFQAQEAEIEKAYSWNLDAVLAELGFLKYWKGRAIDWSQTRCYTSRQLDWNPVAFLRVNLKDRESEGSVAKNRFDATIEEVRQALAGIVYEKSGRPVFEIGPPVYEKQKAGADLLVRPRFEPGDFADTVLLAGKRIPTREMFSLVPLSGTHAIEGILVLSGAGIRPGLSLETCRTIDIAPTVLALAGLPVGEDLQGRAIEEAIDPVFLRQVPIRSIPSYEPLGGRPLKDRSAEADSMAAEVNDAIVDIWKGYGYLNQN